MVVRPIGRVVGGEVGRYEALVWGKYVVVCLVFLFGEVGVGVGREANV